MKKIVLLGGALVILVAFVFGGTAGHEYVIWDDGTNVYENPYLPLEEPLSEVGVFWRRPYEGFYIPVIYTVWAGIAALSETAHYPETGLKLVFSAKLFHLVNVLLHLGSTWLVFTIFYRLLGRRDLVAAALGAAVFAVHPLQVEAVAWVTGLKDVLSAFLALGCTFLYLRHAELDLAGRKRAAGIRYWVSMVLFVLALLCKTHLILLPVALAWFEFLVAKKPVRQLAWKLAPFAAAGLVFTALTFWAQFEPIPVIGSPVAEELALWKRGIVALDALGFYTSKVFYPFGLAADYGRNPARALGLSGIYPLWAVAPIVLGLLAWRVREKKYLFTGVGLAVIALLPVLGLIQFGYQEFSTVADRYLYFPMVGVGFCVAALLTFVGEDGSRRRYFAGALGAVLVLAVTASRQADHWRSCTTLFTHCLEINPKSLTAYRNLAVAAAHSGRVEEAIGYDEKAIELVPKWSGLEAVVSESLGNGYVEMGRYDEALPMLRRAVELQPSSGRYLHRLGLWYLEQGRFPEAVGILEKAMELVGGEPRAAEVLKDLERARAGS